MDDSSGTGEQALDELLALTADIAGSSLAVIVMNETDRRWFADHTEVRLVDCGEAQVAGGTAAGHELRPVAEFPLEIPALTSSLRLLHDGPLVLDDHTKDRVAVLSRQVGQHLALRRRIAQLVVRDALPARSEPQQQPVESEGALSEHRWRDVFDASPVGIGLSDERGTFVAANPALCRLLGRSEPELIGHSSAEFTHVDDLGTHRAATSLINSGRDGIASVEKRYVQPDGTVRWAWLAATHVAGPGGRTWTLTHVQDVTDRKAIEESVRASEANLAAVAGVMQQIHAGSDARQSIVLSGLELAGASVVCLLEPEPTGGRLAVSATTQADLRNTVVPLLSSATGRVLQTGRPMLLGLDDPDRSLAELRHELGMRRIVSALVTPVRAAEQPAGVLVVGWADQVAGFDDRRVSVVNLLADQAGVSLRQASLVTELEALALTDPLTGLPNRRGWERSLTSAVHRSERLGIPLTVAVIDLDHFKDFNDTHGHATGDHLLVRFADLAERQLRGGDIMARWGGEEFVVALPDCEGLTASAVLNRIRTVVPYDQTCSIGYATWNGRESIAEFTARADLAMYAAKHSGRNRVREWIPEA